MTAKNSNPANWLVPKYVTLEETGGLVRQAINAFKERVMKIEQEETREQLPYPNNLLNLAIVSKRVWDQLKNLNWANTSPDSDIWKNKDIKRVSRDFQLLFEYLWIKDIESIKFDLFLEDFAFNDKQRDAIHWGFRGTHKNNNFNHSNDIVYKLFFKQLIVEKIIPYILISAQWYTNTKFRWQTLEELMIVFDAIKKFIDHFINPLEDDELLMREVREDQWSVSEEWMSHWIIKLVGCRDTEDFKAFMTKECKTQMSWIVAQSLDDNRDESNILNWWQSDIREWFRIFWITLNRDYTTEFWVNLIKWKRWDAIVKWWKMAFPETIWVADLMPAQIIRLIDFASKISPSSKSDWNLNKAISFFSTVRHNTRLDLVEVWETLGIELQITN